MTNTDDTLWMVSAQAYMARLGASEYTAQRSAHKKSAKSFSFCPSEYMRGLIDCMNRNDEHAFKARKMLEGYSSSLGV